MAKAEIHIVKDEIGMTTEISGSLIDTTQLFGQAIEICSKKYGIDTKKLCVLITECATAYQVSRCFADKIDSGEMSELEAIFLTQVYINKRKKHIEEQANDE